MTHETFNQLYGKRLNPQTYINAMSSLRCEFAIKELAIAVTDATEDNFFSLPCKTSRNKACRPPTASQDLKNAFSKLSIFQADQEHNNPQNTITETFYKIDESQWALLVSFESHPRIDKYYSSKISILMINRLSHGRNPFEKDLEKVEVGDVRTKNSTDYLPLFSTMIGYFHQLLNQLSFIPTRLLKSEWENALDRTTKPNGKDFSKKRPGLPWHDTSTPQGTVTLSLDMRSSTFAMLQTRNPRQFACWLDAMADICRELTLSSNGIFDKFTGDGCLSHFVYFHGDPNTRAGAVRNGFECALNLLRAVDYHVARIIPSLRYGTPRFGPSVGIAIDEATWSLDRDGRPVVVGRGVVNACRLNIGKKGKVIVTNDFKHFCDTQFPHLPFKIYDLKGKHKEFSAYSEVTAWQLKARYVSLGLTTQSIADIADRCWQQTLQRHGVSEHL